jgi:CTP synthase (UTP-ammonia lyase)
VRIALLIDLPPDARYHVATVDALRHAAGGLGFDLDLRVIETDSTDLVGQVGACDGIVIGPGSPYRDEVAVWDVVRSARERGVPLVGT